MLQTSSLASRAGEFINSLTDVALTPQSQVMQKATLPATFDGDRMQLSGKRRKQINHRQNRLHAAGVTELAICATHEELADATDTLQRLRWDNKHEAGGFRSAAEE